MVQNGWERLRSTRIFAHLSYVVDLLLLLPVEHFEAFALTLTFEQRSLQHWTMNNERRRLQHPKTQGNKHMICSIHDLISLMVTTLECNNNRTGSEANATHAFISVSRCVAWRSDFSSSPISVSNFSRVRLHGTHKTASTQRANPQDSSDERFNKRRSTLRTR